MKLIKNVIIIYHFSFIPFFIIIYLHAGENMHTYAQHTHTHTHSTPPKEGAKTPL